MTAGKCYWRNGSLLVGHCHSCKADYYPDHIAFKRAPGDHVRRLEYDAKYLRISKDSKRGLWCHRRIAVAQEEVIWQFCAGWANYAKFLNALVKDGPQMTYRQSQHLFLEHFGHRLLICHNLSEDFVCPARISTVILAAHLCSAIGENGGNFYSSLHHGCMDCTHRKRYRADLVDEGAVLGENQEEVAKENELELDNNVRTSSNLRAALNTEMSSLYLQEMGNEGLENIAVPEPTAELPVNISVADVQFRTSVQIVNPEPNREFGSRFVFGSCSPVSVRFAVQPYNLRFEQVQTDYSISARFVGFSVI